MSFFSDNFILKNPTGQRLYNDYAKEMPIFDFHCHLDPKEIYENRNFRDITHAWLGGDHYKWRIMRSCGIDEKYITGNAKSLEKFKAFAQALEYAVGSPVYHWAHMELKTFFGINDPLTAENAEEIFNKANALLETDDFKLREFIKKSNVRGIITTDDPVDNLEYHVLLKNDPTWDVAVLPAFRPDKAINIEQEPFAQYIKTLSQVAHTQVTDITGLETALISRINYFAQKGCVASDHGIAYVPYAPADKDTVNAIFKKAIANTPITKHEGDQYKTYLLQFLAGEYNKRNWVMELHYGAIRNINPKKFAEFGPDTGYDAIGNTNSIENMAALFGAISQKGDLPKTMVFNINPNDNYPVAVLIGAFQDRGKMQFGTAWWFNDHINGMVAQINALADVGVLGKFVGMLTDSRSFLSYPRHDYFRRILCNTIGQWIEDGLYNPNIKTVGKIVQDICYNNAVNYFQGHVG